MTARLSEWDKYLEEGEKEDVGRTTSSSSKSEPVRLPEMDKNVEDGEKEEDICASSLSSPEKEEEMADIDVSTTSPKTHPEIPDEQR